MELYFINGVIFYWKKQALVVAAVNLPAKTVYTSW